MANNDISEPAVLVVGAGMAGLSAAAALTRSARAVSVVDKGRRPGGRTAHREARDGSGAAWDHGAQFFTAREPCSLRLVEEWRRGGAATEWFAARLEPDGSASPDGHIRFRGARAMTDMADALSADLERVRCGERIDAITPTDEGWLVSTAGGHARRAGVVICTPPLPQTLQLLDPGLLSGHPELSAIDYEPCIAVLARLDGPSSLAAPGCVRPAGEPIEWIADNHVKGVTAVPGCITVHAGPLTSERLWEQAGAADELLAAARPWVGDSPVLHAQIHRWRYAKPRSVHPERCVALPHPRHGLALPVILAGDAFGGTRVEGAILSGLAAARAVS